MIAAAIAFDFDGVLVDSNSVKRSAFFDIFEPVERSAAEVEATLRDHGELDRFGVIAAVLARLKVREGGFPGTEGLHGDLAERYNDICERHAAVCPEIPGATTTLHSLAARYPLYINSATPEEPLRRIVTRRGWDGLFQDVLGRPQTKVENLVQILEHTRARPHELLFVGDGAGDLAAALAVGCQFVGIRDDSGEFGAQGVTFVDDLHGLPALIVADESSEAAAC